MSAVSARRLLWLTFLAGLALLITGLLVTLASAVAGGDWYLAPEPWIGWGLTLVVLGFVPIHLVAPALIVSLLRPTSWRWSLLLAGLFFAIAVAVLVRFGPNLPLMAYGALLLIWIVTAALISSSSREAMSAPRAAIVLALVGISVMLLALWWVAGWTGLMPGATRGELLDSLRTFMYSAPEFALVMPGLPTLALTVLGVVTAMGAGRSRRLNGAIEAGSRAV